jgi:hypothetical protein
MRSDLRLGTLFLIATAIFAQHGGGFRGSFPTAHGTRSVATPGLARFNGRILSHRSEFRQRFGNGYFAPYYPFLGGYGGYANEYLPAPDYFPGTDKIVSQPSATVMVQPPPTPVQTAQAVVHEYNWNGRPVAPAVEAATFTIALKDGSKRSAIVTWVQGRTLHYTDADDQQGVLSADLIDRNTTRRLNKEKNLYIQLPPG